MELTKRVKLEVAVETMLIQFAHPETSDESTTSRLLADEIVNLVERVLVKGEEPPDTKPWESFAASGNKALGGRRLSERVGEVFAAYERRLLAVQTERDEWKRRAQQAETSPGKKIEHDDSKCEFESGSIWEHCMLEELVNLLDFIEKEAPTKDLSDGIRSLKSSAEFSDPALAGLRWKMTAEFMNEHNQEWPESVRDAWKKTIEKARVPR